MSDDTLPAGRSWADELFEQARAHQECYLAGMNAADANSPSARKLARLIDVAESAYLELGETTSLSYIRNVRERLRAAIAEARSK